MSPGCRCPRTIIFFCLGLCFGLVLHPSSSLMAQIKITSSPNPVGSGARALGMGGAFIAVADDATAASWNPGGLIQLERPELSVVGEGVYRSENNNFKGHPEASGSQTLSQAGLNYLSAVYPFACSGHNMVASINYQHLYDFGRNWNLTYATSQLTQKENYSADGGLYAWGLAYALQIIPELSFGFTLNIWEDGIYPNGWNTETSGAATFLDPRTHKPRDVYQVDYQNRYSFRGFNGNVGLLWNPTDRLSLGAVFKSPFTADLTHRYSALVERISPAPSGSTTQDQTSWTAHEELQMPMSYGFGMAFRLSDHLTVSTDITHTQWQDFILTDSTGKKTSPITDQSPDLSNINGTTQIRVGGEYLFIKPKYTIPVRVGIFYDPAPAQNRVDNYGGFSVGSGIGIGRFIFDVAYVYRFGRGVGASAVPDLNFHQNVNEQNFYTSLIIHF
jgi:long-subunit fatty acid transport protein